MDKNEAQYTEYTSDMPWYAVPESCKDLTKALAARYKVQGIPHLLVFDKDGSLLQQDAVSLLMDHPKEFPWRPKPLDEALPKYVMEQDGDLVEFSSLKDKHVLLYFSAHWCPPCRQFTPQLSKAYTKLKEARGDDFEIIFCSADDSQEEFNEYFGEMTFCALPYDDRQAKKDLSKSLNVRGIPTLVMLSPEGTGGSRTVINPNCVGVFLNSDYISDFPYYPKPYSDLNATSDDINDFKCLVVFHEGGDDEEQEQIVDAVKFAAEQYDGDEPVKFFWALDDKGLVKNVRRAIDLGPPAEEPKMVLLTIADHGSYYVSKEETNITSDNILKFIKDPGTKREIK
jgi:nucleoredoxin